MNRDLALLQDELNCLRKKFNTYLSTNGGYVNGPTTIPDSSVYPDSNYTDCSCVSVDHLAPSILDACAPTDENTDTPLGDIMNEPGVIELGAIFTFDRIDGINLLRKSSSSWENCNTGLSDSGLEHGCVDVFWYKKANPSVDRVILWRVKAGEINRSLNAGLQSWTSRTPTPPSGFTAGQITFLQVVSDPFTIDVFYVIARSSTKAWILRTEDNGTSWAWLDLTGYNGATYRQPLWMAVSGNGGGLLWVTTYNGTNLTLMKINNGSTAMSISSEYSLGSATQFEIDNYFNVGFPFCALDDTSPWIYGRMVNPQSLGLSHVIKVNNDGLSFSAVTTGWGLDWCGEFHASLGPTRQYYAIRNPRTFTGNEGGGGGPVLVSDGLVMTGNNASGFYTGFAGTYLFDGNDSNLYVSRSVVDPATGSITGRTTVDTYGVITPLGGSYYDRDLPYFGYSGSGYVMLSPPSSSSPVRPEIDSTSAFVSYPMAYMTTSTVVGGNRNYSSVAPTNMSWLKSVGGDYATFTLDGSGVQHHMAVHRLDSTSVLAVRCDASGYVGARVVYADVPNDQLAGLGQATSSNPVDWNSSSWLIKTQPGEYAFVYYSGSAWKISLIQVAAAGMSVTIGTPVTVSFPADPVGMCYINSTTLGAVVKNGSNVVYYSVGTSGSLSSPVTITSSDVSDNSLSVGYGSGYAMIAYFLTGSNQLRVASVSV